MLLCFCEDEVADHVIPLVSENMILSLTGLCFFSISHVFTSKEHRIDKHYLESVYTVR